MTNKLLYIIDTYALVFQVFHAIPSMTGPKGQATNAIFGITRDLLTILKAKQPTHLLAAMESTGAGVRNEIYADYKANRSEMPDDLRPQIPGILEIFAGFRIPVVECPGWEADDVIATLASRAANDGFDVRIVTNDKDIRQLISPRIKIYNVRKDTLFDEADLQREWGVRPDQVIDFQSLVGDSVDNVPGVPLVGPKKAGALLEQYGTLDAVLAHADEVAGAKLRENLKTFAEQARVSRKLVELQTDLPLQLDFDTAAVHAPDRRRLLQLFTDFGFRRFGDELPPGDEPSAPPTPQIRTSKIVDDPQKFAALVAELGEQRRLCFDIETAGDSPLRSEIVGWALCWRTNEACYIPVQGPPGQRTLDGQLVLKALQPILENPEIEKTSHDIKHELLVLRRYGVDLQGIGVDPMVGDYLLDAGARTHDLHNLAQRYVQQELAPVSDLVGAGKQQKLMFEVDVEKVSAHAAEDVDIAWQVGQRVAEELKQQQLWDLYWELERPLISVLADMELHGMRVDVDELRRQSRALDSRLAQLIQEIYALAGREFNIGSPKQLGEVLFDELRLPVLKRTRTGSSTNQEVLEKLALQHELPAKIIEHRQLAKLKGTYLDALPLLVNPATGRIHASFDQVVAATGRLSAHDPNLQNIPIRTEEGRLTRRAFVPSAEGLSLVCADYSQIELRVLAHFSGDVALCAAFQEGVDIHQAVAAEIFGVDPAGVDSGMRRIAKAVNFGVIYGQSPYGLSEALQISRQDAARFIDRYFTRYNGVERYLHQILEECLRSGYARTILGRRREITGIRSTTGRQRNLPERTAINSVIQGSAADLIKRAMINVHNRLRSRQHPAQMLLQIHDELVFETPDNEVDSLLQIVKHEMEHAMDLNVPLVVDLAVGKNWLEVEGVE